MENSLSEKDKDMKDLIGIVIGIAFIAIAGLLPLIVLRPRRPQSDFLACRAAELNPGILEDVSRRREL